MSDASNNSAASLKGKQGIERVLAALRYSWSGLKQAWQHEAAFREECVLLCLFFPAAFWLGETPLQVALLVMSCLLVLIVELLNSAIETVVDRVGLERHELSGRAKDMGSAAVLISLLQVVLVWSLVAWQRFG